MTHLLSKGSTILLLILMPLLVSLACLTLTGGSAGDSQTPDGVESVEADVVVGPGAFIYPDPEAGLSGLSGYKATLTLSFEGIRDGNAQQWSKTYVMLTTQEPAARQLTIEKSGDNSDPDAVFMAELDGAAYERRGENACSATVIQEGISLVERWEPAGFLTGVIGAEEAGDETVNDVAAKHYTFDERAFGQLDIAQSTGEMWVASDGGYILKYLVTTKGNADYFGEGIEGTLTWDYGLTDINQAVTFELPADCPAGMVNAPQLPDSADVVNMPGLLTYTSVTSLADAAAFYQEQIPNLGWELLGEPDIRESAIILDYQQGGQNLTVIITDDAGVRTVTILLEKVQE